ncbi:MAG: ISAs1 family transposase, partial [Mycobacteriaceae bacterium]|nr:ISAs1 family transposase [Mycobacteriaceae bacterium]
MSRAAPLLDHFSDLIDPRIARTREHSLESILFIAICAVIAGEDDWVGIEEFARDKVDFFEQFVDLPSGIPSHDTFGRVFAALDTERFAQGFTRWVQSVGEALALPSQDVIAIDGKTMRRTFDKANSKAAIHLVSAFTSGNRLVLGQVKVGDKSNEITAIPELLRRLTLTGCLVTLDAMGCQKQIAQDITTAGADYLLALKGNHGDLHQDVIDHFEHVDNTATLACHRHEAVD